MNYLLLRRLIVLITIAISLWFVAFFGKGRGTFYGDGMGYYMYLPSFCIYHDPLHINYLPDNRAVPAFILQDVKARESSSVRSGKGYAVNQYTYGVAFMEMPFFLLAHWYELARGLPANGYSETYSWAIKVSAILYALLGLLLVYKILCNYVNKTQSLITVALIFLGTNLFWFTLCQAGMSHVPLFFLYALLIYLTIEFHKRPVPLLFITAGFAAGLITIIRPTDIICVLIPLVYNVYNRESFKNKLAFISGNFKGVLLFGIAFVIPVIPQLIYWKALTGNFIFYSYGSQSFDWTHPKIIEGVFSYKNGWLPYSMIMIYSLAGLFLYRSIKPWAWCAWLLLPVYIYIIYSWYCYNYINGLGSRPMIHLYSLLAIPFAAFLQYIAERRLIARSCFWVICVFFISVNICYSMQQQRRILFSEDSNMAFNIHMLYRMKLNYKDFVCMDNGIVQPGNEEIRKISTLACENYDDSASANYVKNEVTARGYVYHMLNGEEYIPNPVKVKYNKEKFGDAKWLKCSGMFKVVERPDYYGSQLWVLDIKHGDKLLVWAPCKIANKIGLAESTAADKEINLDHYEGNKWGQVYFYVKIPANISDGDEITLGIWNIPKKEMYMDNICIELYK